MLRYKRINSAFNTDTLFATDKAKSTRGNKCCQLIVSDKGFVAVYPMETVSQFEDVLHFVLQRCRCSCYNDSGYTTNLNQEIGKTFLRTGWNEITPT